MLVLYHRTKRKVEVLAETAVTTTTDENGKRTTTVEEKVEETGKHCRGMLMMSRNVHAIQKQ